MSVAKTLPSPQVYDVVEGYVKISMECAEIFKLLDGERKPENEVSWTWGLYFRDWQLQSKQSHPGEGATKGCQKMVTGAKAARTPGGFGQRCQAWGLLGCLCRTGSRTG